MPFFTNFTKLLYLVAFRSPKPILALNADEIRVSIPKKCDTDPPDIPYVRTDHCSSEGFRKPVHSRDIVVIGVPSTSAVATLSSQPTGPQASGIVALWLYETLWSFKACWRLRSRSETIVATDFASTTSSACSRSSCKKLYGMESTILDMRPSEPSVSSGCSAGRLPNWICLNRELAEGAWPFTSTGNLSTHRDG